MPDFKPTLNTAYVSSSFTTTATISEKSNLRQNLAYSQPFDKFLQLDKWKSLSINSKLLKLFWENDKKNCK